KQIRVKQAALKSRIRMMVKRVQRLSRSKRK
ncbi:hypothetical protein A5883_002489, partial [Enterococcus sp. 5B3_DIV0040]